MAADTAYFVRNRGLRTKLEPLPATPIAGIADKPLGQCQSQVCPQSRVADNTLLVLISSGVLENPELRGSGGNYRPTTGRQVEGDG